MGSSEDLVTPNPDPPEGNTASDFGGLLSGGCSHVQGPLELSGLDLGWATRLDVWVLVQEALGRREGEGESRFWKSSFASVNNFKFQALTLGNDQSCLHRQVS